MAINRVEIKNFLVFKGEFTTNFCTGVNVLIGGNGTGKTTLLKIMYNGYRVFKGDAYNTDEFHTVYLNYFTQMYSDIMPELFSDIQGNFNIKETKYDTFALYFQLSQSDYTEPIPEKGNMRKIGINAVYIPEKDILEHSRGLLTFIDDKQTGFSQIYKDILIKAMDTQTQNKSPMQKSIEQTINNIIGGTVHLDKDDGSFYTLHTDGNRISFANEASGYKKLGFLGLLVACGQLKKGSILFWDEPENSLNPELIPMLVNILLELSRNGVQIFIATHSEIFASYIAVNRQNADHVLFTSLYIDDGRIKANTSDRFDLLEPNHLTAEPVKLYMKQIDRGLGGNG